MLKTTIKNLYEVLLIIKPNLSEDELGKSIEQVEASIKNYGGSILKIEEPFKRRFAHKVKGFKDGYYIPIMFTSPPELPNTLKRTLSISSDVLRYSIVRKESSR